MWILRGLSSLSPRKGNQEKNTEPVNNFVIKTKFSNFKEEFQLFWALTKNLYKQRQFWLEDDFLFFLLWELQKK